MKNTPLSVLIALCLSSSLFGKAQPAEDLLLRGILDSGNTQVFSISGSDGQGSSWVKIGQSYKGYSLDNYDAESKTLTLKKADEVFSLNLEASQGGTDAGDATSRLEEAQKIMDMIDFEEMIEDSLDAQVVAMQDAMKQQMLAQNPNADVSSDMFKEQMKVIENMFKGIDWKPIKEGITTVYAEVFTQSELEAMSSFYASPAGQSTIEKTPEIQRRTTELMMPALMQASQKAFMGTGQ